MIQQCARPSSRHPACHRTTSDAAGVCRDPCLTDFGCQVAPPSPLLRAPPPPGLALGELRRSVLEPKVAAAGIDDEALRLKANSHGR
jgi:hypothetical protein